MHENESASGAPIFNHVEAAPFELAPGDQAVVAAVEAHAENHFGPVEHVFHELVSPYVHVDLHFVMPTDERPFITVMTSGMSERPMADGTYAELTLALPPAWPTPGHPDLEKAFWPLAVLKELARLPHEYDTALGYGHTVPNGPSAKRYARDTKLCCAMLGPMLTAPEGAERFEHDGHEVLVHALWLLHADEMQLKLDQGLEPLADRFDAAGVTEVLDPRRPSVVAKPRRGFFRR